MNAKRSILTEGTKNPVNIVFSAIHIMIFDEISFSPMKKAKQMLICNI